MVSRLHLFLEKIVDICFPPSEEALHVRTLTRASVERLYSLKNIDGVVTLSSFNDPHIRALIHEAKFQRNRYAQTLLAHLVERFLVTSTLQMSQWVPVPLSRSRLRTRGYNQVVEVLNALPNHIRPNICLDLLVRTRDTRPQTELDRAARLSNMTNVFAVTKPSLIRDQNIILIDDVMTTGATLRAAEAALRPHSPRSITLLSLAH